MSNDHLHQTANRSPPTWATRSELELVWYNRRQIQLLCMCGIAAYIGQPGAVAAVIKSLKRLEYRGYDSAGVAAIETSGPDAGSLKVVKRVGKVSALEAAVGDKLNDSTIAIGHTRWATHGEPSIENAHPHVSSNGRFALVHNGIIENYASLKTMLVCQGYTFKSETDTEVLSVLFEFVSFSNSDMNFLQLTQSVLAHVHGAYSIVVLSDVFPGELVGARRGSPLMLGVGDNIYTLASDASAVAGTCTRVVHFEDGDVVHVSKEGFQVCDAQCTHVNREFDNISVSLEEIEKGTYKHFMHKEIADQPQSLRNCVRGRVNPHTGDIKLGGIEEVMEKLLRCSRIVICACGTSWHAGLIGEYYIEKYARTVVEVEYASEFVYRNPILSSDDAVLVISQSGETADTLAAAKLAKSRGCIVLGIVNVVGSSIARVTDAGIYMHAGPEIGVASTKAFTAQVTALLMFAIMLAKSKQTYPLDKLADIGCYLARLPEVVQKTLDMQKYIRDISREYKLANHFLYLARGLTFPVALEGCLKLKEISYIHAEGYPAAEMKHGPIALIDPLMPVVFVVSKSDENYAKVLNNVNEVLSRKGSVIIVTEESNSDVDDLADHILRIPDTIEPVVPILSIIPLQLLAYHVADLRRCSVDQPRNLAKSVTVE